MRLILLALLVSAGRLAAQHPSADASIAILRAATSDTTERLAHLRVVGDTTWATIVNPHDREVAGGFPGREVRLQRRAGSWTVVTTRTVVVPPPHPMRPAKPFSFSDTLPKRP